MAAMKTKIEKIRENVSKPAFRIYAVEEGGPATRIGRTYRTLKACLKVASDLSRHFDHVEVTDDNMPRKERLQAIVRQGQILAGADFRCTH